MYSRGHTLPRVHVYTSSVHILFADVWAISFDGFTKFGGCTEALYCLGGLQSLWAVEQRYVVYIGTVHSRGGVRSVLPWAY